MMAAIEAKRAAAEAAEAAAEKIAWTEGSSPAPGWSKHIYNLSHAAFDAADRGSRDGSLSANEMRTFLPGSRFRHFGHWFCRDRKPRSYFQSFAQGDGSIEVEELYPAVHKYLARTWITWASGCRG